LKDFQAICPPFTSNEGGFLNSFFAALLVLCLAALPGCRTTGSASAEAIGCAVGDVEILKSRYSREGITTTWCARCKLKTYRCVSNPERSRAECRPAEARDECG
jgi:hypothetical protein